MREAYEISRENMEKAGGRNKKYYDKKLRSTTLYPGDRILVRNLTPRGGTGKLCNHWEETIHTVVRQVKENLPIFEVKPELGKGRSRILHRNLLLSCDHLPMEGQSNKDANLEKRLTKDYKKRSDIVETDRDEEDEDECCLYYSPNQQHSGEGCNEGADELERGTSGLAKQIENIAEIGDQMDAVGLPEDRCLGEEDCDEELIQTEDPLITGQGEEDDENTLSPEQCNDLTTVERQSRPQRERCAPRLFTYDHLGTPSVHKLI